MFFFSVEGILVWSMEIPKKNNPYKPKPPNQTTGSKIRWILSWQNCCCHLGEVPSRLLSSLLVLISKVSKCVMLSLKMEVCPKHLCL